jgi:uncharacterized protein (DUF1800 family)
MKATLRIAAAAALVLCAAWAGAAVDTQGEKPLTVHMPWKQSGLTERQAAAHLLNRFAFGPRPGEVDAAVKMGLDRWLERQLGANLPDDKVREDLQILPALNMTTAQILQTYPPVGMVLQQAKQAGVIPDDVKKGDLKNKENEDQREALKTKVKAFAAEKGYRPEKELLGQLMTQKLVRAVESENQLQEVMTDFWFNHFNVSLTDNKARPFLLSYERDAIRPHALGSFRDLLEATAKSPAMLVYLDNAQSTAAADEPTTMQDEMGRTPRQRARFGGRGLGRSADPAMRPFSGQGMIAGRQGGLAKSPLAPKRKQQGVNENYARELMELHTLGVDGGYTQQDVVEVARAFTGWTILPVRPQAREAAETRLARAERAGGLGFHQEGDFLFRADAHDAAPKTILGAKLPSGRGIEDGEAVLDLLAAQKATARHISTKLAVRFVSDHPPQPLIDRLTDVYLTTHGDIRRMIVMIAESPEFWDRDAVGSKIKSPFELTASALRVTDGEIVEPREILKWVNRMGQPLYAYQAPTGYPDRAEAWVNTGSLLNRMNFGLQLAANRVKGVSLNLPALNGGRDLTATLKQLTPMVADPSLAKRVDQAAPKETAKKGDANEDLLDGGSEMAVRMPRSVKVRGMLGDEARGPVDRRPPTSLEQVVGVILGSPEFQRR